jgi:hypothetical protein
MCATFNKSAIWKFANPREPSIYEAVISSHNADPVVNALPAQSCDQPIEPVAKQVGQCFWIAFSEELHRRGFIADRVDLRAFMGTEKLIGRRDRIRVELEVITRIARSTHNDFIDALIFAKRRCLVCFGPDVKILLKAELRADVESAMNLSH